MIITSFNRKEHLVKIKAAKTQLQREERLNTRNLMNCGIGATIIEYKNANNITVQFDDGEIVYNKTYYDFTISSIAHPNRTCKRITSINEYIILWYFSKLGFKKATSGSLKKLGFGRMELDCYNSDLKIAIEYDGAHWHNFANKKKTDERKNKICKKNGIRLIRIREPGLEPMVGCENFILDSSALFSQSLEQVLNILIHRMNTFVEIDFNKDKQNILNDFAKKYKSSKVGETSIASNGETMTIIAYRNNRDLDIEFDSGVILKHRRYDWFKKGYVSNDPDKYRNKKEERLNKRECMHCGEYATIIRYKSVNDIDVMFDDGTISEHRTYQEFKNCTIKNPNHKKRA